jgi:hypothetical protein
MIESNNTHDKVGPPEFRKKFIENVDYWRALNPEFNITDDPWPRDPEPYPISSEEMESHVERMKREGYFQTSPIIPRDQLDKLRKSIVNIVAWGLRSTYALLYDEFYDVFGRLDNVLKPVLADRYRFVPDEFEAYLIPTTDDAAGTPPHRDSLLNRDCIGSDGLPKVVNVWIPLTDATTLNSCIHVLPGHLDPLYRLRASTADEDADAGEHVPLQNIRALPAPAGSVLCWNPNLLHWGGRSSRWASHPRLSFAAYFQSRDVPPVHPTTMDIPSRIPFEYRLYLVEKVWKDPKGKKGPPNIFK